MLRNRVLTLTNLGHPVTIVENTVEWAPDRHGPGPARCLFIGGVHGDEPEGVELATRLVVWLTRQAATFDWQVIPCLNPDGFFSNPRRRTNGRGVDLNRNFPSRDWVPHYRDSRYCPGLGPASELETRALVECIRTARPNLIVHFHSIENPCIVYSGEGGLAAATLLGTESGYPVRPEIGYPTPGSLGQYGLLDLNVPVICVEEKEGVDPLTIWPRFETAFSKMIANLNHYAPERKNV